MQTIYSPLFSATLPTAQYLFRVWHSPITHTDYSNFIGYDKIKGDDEVPGWQTYALNFNDHLFSIPPDTAVIIDTANRLAYAESLLYVDSKIPFITVWLVETTKGIDHTSPVVVLTHWNGAESKFAHHGFTDARNEPLNPQPSLPYNMPPLMYQYDYPGIGFESYDLVGRPDDATVSDPFIVLDVARQVEGGQCRKQWFKGCVTTEDYYRESDGRLMLPSAAPLMSCRFPWFQATLEEMQYTHSGANIDELGKLSIGKVALSLRVANCLVDAAEMRRKMLFNYSGAGQCWQAWWECVTYVSYWLRAIDVAGFAEAQDVPMNPFGDDSPQGTISPTEAACNICRAVSCWANRQAILTGSNSLASWLPFTTGLYTKKWAWEEFTGTFHNYYTDFQPNPYKIAEHSDSTSWRTFTAIIDLVGAIAGTLAIYVTELNDAGFYNRIPQPDYTPIAAYHIADIHNAFSNRWERLQGDLQALFHLLFTWEFQFRPALATRSQAHDNIAKTKKMYRPRWQMEDWRLLDFETEAKFPHLDGRVSEVVPLFTPPRTWAVVLTDPLAGEMYTTLQREADLTAYNLAMQQQRDARAAEQAARTAYNHAQMQALQNYIGSGSGANPLDPWDWRNYTRKSFWLTPIKAQDVPQFVANALNTPNEITVAQNVFNLSPRVVNGLRRIEPLIIAVRDVVYGELLLRDLVRSRYFRKIVREIGTGLFKEAVSQAQSQGQSYVIGQIAGTNPAYSPRQFFPPDLTKEEMWGPTGGPPDGYSPGSSSGGGGGGAWGNGDSS